MLIISFIKVTIRCCIFSNTRIEFTANIPSWMHGYNGPIESGYVLSDGGIGIKSSERYVPNLRGNDVLLFTTQVDGARYAANDFNLDCRIQGRI